MGPIFWLEQPEFSLAIDRVVIRRMDGWMDVCMPYSSWQLPCECGINEEVTSPRLGG